MHQQQLRETLKPMRLQDKGAHKGALKELRERRGEMSEQMKAHLKELAQTRAERRSKRRADLSKRWGHWIEVRAHRPEFTRHAWRMARLRRIHQLAVEQKNTALVERAQKLIDKEQQRHSARLEKLKARGSSPAGSASAPSAASAPTPSPASSQE
jgi:hypothetical protein